MPCFWIRKHSELWHHTLGHNKHHNDDQQQQHQRIGQCADQALSDTARIQDFAGQQQTSRQATAVLSRANEQCFFAAGQSIQCRAQGAPASQLVQDMCIDFDQRGLPLFCLELEQAKRLMQMHPVLKEFG